MIWKVREQFAAIVAFVMRSGIGADDCFIANFDQGVAVRINAQFILRKDVGLTHRQFLSALGHTISNWIMSDMIARWICSSISEIMLASAGASFCKCE